jgi:type IV pilus assembly protein PilW
MNAGRVNMARVFGFSLIELMIAILLGSLLMLAVTEIVTRNSSVRNELARSSERIENGTYAINLLVREISSAGFWGETGAQVPDPNGPPSIFAGTDVDPGDALDAIDELTLALGYPIHGGTATGDGVPLSFGPSTDSVDIKDGTDYLVIRRGNSCAFNRPGCADDDVGSDDVYLQVNSCFDPVTAGAPIPGEIRLAQRTGATSFAPSLNFLPVDCGDSGEDAPIYRFLDRIYFVDTEDNLVRAELNGGAFSTETLVPGVELLRFGYGLDNGPGVARGDGQIDEFDVPDPVDPSEWADVVSIRVSMVVRSLASTAGFNDDRTYTVEGQAYTVDAFQDHKRQVYSRTVSVKNIGGRRE